MVDYVRLATRKNIWYYRDRMSVPRGPCPLPVLRECWVSGIIDENTLVWGQGLADWLPIRNVRTLVAQIRTPEGAHISRAAFASSCLRSLAATCSGMPLQPISTSPSTVVTLEAHAGVSCAPEELHEPFAARIAAVQLATWVKRTFALKPALESIRKHRGEQRQLRTSQVDDMY